MKSGYYTTPRKEAFALLGGLMALGAPIGLVLVRSSLAKTPPTPAWVAAEVRRDIATYSYIAASTTLVFTVLGFFVGRMQDHLRELAFTDPLSGVFNRRQLLFLLATEVAGSARSGEPVSLLLMDVDNLKSINDHLGHLAGDAALRAIASRVRAGVRAGDVVARIGGDEFAVLLRGTDAEEAERLAGRLLARVRDQDVPGVGQVSVSIGASDIQDGDPEVLLAAADEALYRAKRAGRGRVMVQTREDARRFT